MNKSKLKEILQERGLKQEWLAQQVGIVSTTMSRIVTGRFLPNLRTAQRISHVLGVSIDELWPLEDDDEGKS